MVASYNKNGEMKKILLLTSWIWEGSYILKSIIDHRIPLQHVVIQSAWWCSPPKHGYSLNYLRKYILDKTLGLYGNRYFSVPMLARQNRIEVSRVRNINDELELLRELDPDIIVVAGSRIINKKLVREFRSRIINFHTGILPKYRGLYSECWAMYNNDYKNVGTTIHKLDEGIDTGEIIGRSYLTERFETPEDCHDKNTKMGSELLCQVLVDFVKDRMKSFPQNEVEARYYSSPSREQYNDLQKRVGKEFDISFAE